MDPFRTSQATRPSTTHHNTQSDMAEPDTNTSVHNSLLSEPQRVYQSQQIRMDNR